MVSKIANLLVVGLLSIGATVAAAAPQVTGKHGEIGVPCAGCHGSEAPAERAPATACTQCHGTYEQLADKTANVNPNPHKSHQGEVRCTLCHKTHQPSVLFCNECHEFELKVK